MTIKGLVKVDAQNSNWGSKTHSSHPVLRQLTTFRSWSLSLPLLYLNMLVPYTRNVSPVFIVYRNWETSAWHLTFLNAIMCWYGSLGVRGKKVLNDVVNVCSKVVRKKQACMQDLYERRLKRKARQITVDQSHVLAKFFELLPSGRRYRTVKGKERFLKT